MSERVLVPTDGSPLARRALEYAVDHHPDAEITVLHVVDPVDAVYRAEGTGQAATEEWLERARGTADEEVRAVSDRAAERDVELAAATEVGNPARTVVAYVEDHDVDCVVLGSHGRSGIERAVLGSVAESVVRRSTVPVTVVR